MKDWTSALLNAGIPPEALSGKNVPCPMCGGTDRFKFDNKWDRGGYFCRGCGAGNAYGLVMKYHDVGYLEARNMMGEYTPSLTTQKNTGALERNEFQYGINRMYEQITKLVPAKDTPAEQYLINRGLELPTPFPMNVIWNGTEVDINMGAYYLEDFFKKDDKETPVGAIVWTMICPMQHGYVLSSLHSTLIDEDGTKAEGVVQHKKYSSKTHDIAKWQYRVVPLMRGNAPVCLLGEGIESTLAGYQLWRSVHPEHDTPSVFASADAGMMRRFTPFSKSLKKKEWVILADNDSSRTGQYSAGAAACGIGDSVGGYRKVKIVKPTLTDRDWSDVLSESPDPVGEMRTALMRA